MRHIYEYIINKNTKLVKNSDFKQFESKEEVCEFLENKGFEKTTYDDYHDGHDDLISKFLNSHKPIYCTGKFTEIYDVTWWVRFGNGGKDEYIFFWNVKGTLPNNYVVRNSNDEIIKKIKTFEEFKEYVINYFNW